MMFERNAFGFTLVEAVVYLAVLAVLASALASLSVASQRTSARVEAAWSVESQGTSALSRILLDVGNADALLYPLAGSDGPSVSIEEEGKVVSFEIFDGVLHRIEGDGNPEPLTASDVRASSMIADNRSAPETPGSLRVGFTLSHAGGYEQTFVGTATLR